MWFKVLAIFLFFLFALTACGSGDSGKVSKGHRDAIHIECKDDPDKKLCGREVRSAFIEDGNEFVLFDDLNKDQKRRVKMECVRSKKYGLKSYNDCLEKNKEAALNGTITQTKIAKKPKNYIEKLEKSVIYIELTLSNFTKKEELPFTSGSGVIVSKKNIATNCHVAMAKSDAKVFKFAREKLKWDLNNDDIKKRIWVKNINGKEWAEAKLTKENPSKDICILKHDPKDLFEISMKPITKFGSFNKLKKGTFVRAMGSPGGMEGFASEGSIQWLGVGKDLDRNFGGSLLNKKDGLGFDKNTKFIVHGARVHQGSSGGPLFDKDGTIIGLNTLISDTAAENIAVSADHIKELLNE